MKSEMKAFSIWSAAFMLMLCGLVSYSLSVSEPSATIETQGFVSVTLPLSMDRYNIPIVEMKVADKTVHIAIDTGADWVTLGLKPSVLKTLDGIEPLRFRNNKDFYGNTYRSKCFIIPTASLGNARARVELSHLIASEELRSFGDDDGIIGNGLLKEFYVLIDYPARQMVLFSKNSYPAELDLATWSKLSFTHNQIGIIVKGKLGEKGPQILFCLDSGCAAVDNQEKSYGIIRPQYVPENDRIIKDGVSYTATDHFYLGGKDLGPMEFMVSDFKQPPVTGFLGHNILIHYRVFVDFDKQLLFLREA